MMLKFSDKLDKYIKSIIPLIILSNEYKIIGSYSRTKYITDIDITNFVKNDMNFEVKLNDIVKELPKNIKLFTLTSGFDKDYQVPWNIMNENKLIDYDYIKSVNFINELYFNHKITDKERDLCNNLLTEKPIIRDIILIEDLLYPKSKIKWNINEIKQGYMKKDNQTIDLNTSIRENDHNIIHYIIEYENDIIPIDIGIIKKDHIKQEKIKEFDKQIYIMFVKKEYYFILAYLKKYIRDKKEINKIKYLLNDKFGYYKQILMNIFYLIQFIDYPIFDNKEYNDYFTKVIEKITTTDIDKQILKELNKNIHDRNNLKELLKQLEIKVLNELNTKFKEYAYKYYLQIPNKNQINHADIVFDIVFDIKN